MDGFELYFYAKEDNTESVAEFLDSLEPKLRAKATRDLALLQEKGSKIREPQSKALSDGLFELRIIQSNDIVRVFYFFYVGKKIIATNGFIKKTRRTPKSEIDRARLYKKDWEERQKREQKHDNVK